MLPWSTGGGGGRLTYLQMQNCVKCNKIWTDRCNWWAATPNVPNQAPMPQASKQLLNVCPIPPVHIIVRLLAGCQSAILSSNEWHNDSNPPL